MTYTALESEKEQTQPMWVQAGHSLNHPAYTAHLPFININNKTTGMERQTNNQGTSDNWSVGRRHTEWRQQLGRMCSFFLCSHFIA
jgi:hypothetical protein